MFFDLPPFDKQQELLSNPMILELDETPTMSQVLELDEGIIEIADPPRELLAIGIDQGGNQVYLSLAGRYPGAIYLWMNWQDIYFAADSFDEFMQSLEHEE